MQSPSHMPPKMTSSSCTSVAVWPVRCGGADEAGSTALTRPSIGAFESGDEENASVGLGATRAPTGREGATFVTGRPSRTRPEATYIVWLGRQAWVKHYSWVHALVVQPIVPDS